jgi:ammonium transporter, Amt family
VTNLPVPALSEGASVICLVCILLVPLAAGGLALINAGLGRSRSAAHTMIASLCTLSVAAIVYFVCGFAVQGFTGQPTHILAVGGEHWDWLGAGPVFFRRFDLDGSPASLAAGFSMLCVGLAALIPIGAAAERWRLRAACASTALLAGFTFPLFAHWVWGRGWLAQLGIHYGLGHGFVDVGGSGCIQVVGGLTALSIVWILGPRRGKYSASKMPNAIPAHNAVFVILGAMLCWAGWLGLNSAGAILFGGAASGQTLLVAVNTTLAAASAGLAALAVTGLRFGRPDASLTCNGWIGGLVASSAGCIFIKPAEAVVIGAIAGVLVTYAVEWLEFGLKVDDPGGSISAHAVGGIWGLLAAGLFARFPTESGSDSGQFMAQLVGIATLIGFVFPATYGLNRFLNWLVPYRVSLEGERQGMDLHELGADAYPEFVVHTEEFLQR